MAERFSTLKNSFLNYGSHFRDCLDFLSISLPISLVFIPGLTSRLMASPITLLELLSTLWKRTLGSHRGYVYPLAVLCFGGIGS